MTIEYLKELISNGENMNVEYKECTNEVSHSLYESVCSFLNHSGGTVIMGIDDNRNVTGVNPNKAEDLKKNIINTLNNKTLFTPSPYFTPEVFIIDDKTVIVLEIPCGSYVYSYKGRFWERNGDADTDVTERPELLLSLFERKNPHIFEERFVDGLAIGHLDKDAFTYCRNIIHVKNPSHVWLQMTDEELLLSSKLAERNHETGVLDIRYAALILFGTEDALATFMPRYRFEALFHMCTWQQYERNELVDNRYDDRVTLRCNLIMAYGQLLQFVQRHLPDKFYLPPSSVSREDIRIQLMREIIGNLCVHTDFGLGFACFFEIFRDRVVTKNPTRLIPTAKEGSVTLNELGNYTKNPLLVKVFREMDWVEDLGSGTRNILKYAPLYYNDYKIEVDNGQHFSFSITYAKDGESNGGINGGINGTLNTPNENQLNTLKFIAQYTGCNTPFIAKKRQVPFDTIDKHVRYLLAQNYIIRRGSKKTGGYVLTDKGRELIKKK